MERPRARCIEGQKAQGNWSPAITIEKQQHREGRHRESMPSVVHAERSRLLQNFRLYAGMRPSVTKQVVSLMGHDDKGNGVPFRLRVKTEQTAQELKDVLDKEAPS